ncbi:hypothetical protein AVEN_87717-1 [Araneus ventricosus]|uniref:Uncharacterized protein n=1 Tax=Araneus ventricosus TaxID=182803 RepID=A0A4Y2RE83_ARAVE|nr:hypothetical protein AVEN_87717-1 [Araneus ventricosus]
METCKLVPRPQYLRVDRVHNTCKGRHVGRTYVDPESQIDFVLKGKTDGFVMRNHYDDCNSQDGSSRVHFVIIHAWEASRVTGLPLYRHENRHSNQQNVNLQHRPLVNQGA